MSTVFMFLSKLQPEHAHQNSVHGICHAGHPFVPRPLPPKFMKIRIGPARNEPDDQTMIHNVIQACNKNRNKPPTVNQNECCAQWEYVHERNIQQCFVREWVFRQRLQAVTRTVQMVYANINISTNTEH